MRQELGRENTVFVHLTLVPWISARAGIEDQAHPALGQGTAFSIGIQADILMCRSDRPPSRDIKQKIAAFCNVEERASHRRHRRCPRSTRCRSGSPSEGVDSLILKYLHKEAPEADLSKWKELIERVQHPKGDVNIAIVSKYVEYEDSYKSLKEALTHGALFAPPEAEC